MRECFYKYRRWAIFASIISLGLIFNNEGISSDDGKTLWSLNKISLVEPPVIKADTWSRNEIDKFILQKLRSVGIEPNPAADKLTTIRRVSFDLLGLAPTREEIQKFEADKSGNSYEKLLDSLLANPHYGERWGRHWLDVARFGESHGYESDNERPHAWTYRDAVIKALNQNLPFDEFVKWQVAGDILRPEDSLAVSLTGFLSAGSTVTNVDGVDREKANYDKMDDIVSATGSAFLGLTVGCARCHNHKYDPISQEDYYKMVGFFLPGREGDRELEIGKPGSKVKAMVWNGGKKRSNPILKRGDVEQKGEDVGVGVLTALSDNNGDSSEWLNEEALKKGDGRDALAHWLTDSDKGAGHLLARVIVNRLWQHHFGVGLVKTSNNFGQVGEKPTHPELLDWLAQELINKDWKIKSIHKLIMKSSTYMQTVKWDQPRYEIDPENKLFWRKEPRRLEGEIIRDSIMNTAGTLNRKMFGPSVKPWVSKDAINTGSTNKWPVNVKDGPDTWRRSIYVFMRRSMRVPFFEVFDVPDGMQSRGVRELTTVPTQALMLMNNQFVRDQASHFANRIRKAVGNDNLKHIVEEAYWLALSRSPTNEELSSSVELLSTEGQSLENFCHILFTLNEFCYVD
ncbi:MAG: DUF1549 and DUF1553 domain-containing protein [Verrucomicrobiota bacterium]|nr:DUF1549 and DUF1553 domain-containing protein [Verrucomicrobiota bacterium]